MGSIAITRRRRRPARSPSTASGSTHAQVTNEQFAAFVDATGYVTVAERPLDPADFPARPAENLVPGSLSSRRTAGPSTCAT